METNFCPVIRLGMNQSTRETRWSARRVLPLWQGLYVSSFHWQHGVCFELLGKKQAQQDAQSDGTAHRLIPASLILTM